MGSNEKRTKKLIKGKKIDRCQLETIDFYSNELGYSHVCEN